MAYIINKTNGEQLLILEDGTLNTDTSLGLLGKNTIGYGEVQNENFVHLLENFAGVAPPAGTILKGQLFFETGTTTDPVNLLKVYDGAVWNVVGNAIISDTEPTTTVQGSTWVKTSTQQLYAYNNGWRLIGPEAVAGFGVTRNVADSVVDTLGNTHAIIKTTVDGEVIAITSSDVFTIGSGNPIPGFSILKAGITLSTQVDIKGNIDGNAITATTLQHSRTINGVPFDGSSDITITAAANQNLTRGSYLLGDSYNGSSSVTWGVDAASANYPDKVVVRDGNGDFGARTVSANLVGDVKGNVFTLTGTSQFNQVVAAGITSNVIGNLTGNADTATILSTPRSINGVLFDGSQGITIKANTTQSLVAGQYILGGDFNGAAVRQWDIQATPANENSKIVARDTNGNFVAGTITANLVGNVTGNVNTIGGTSTFNNLTANQITGNVIGNVTGGAGSATRLQYARTINGVPFDGTSNIVLKASTTAALSKGAYLTGSGSFDGSAPTSWGVDASSTNIAGTVVARDSSGNFTAGTINANLNGNVSGNLTGNVSGNVTGNTTGTHYGNVQGNVSGNVSGNVTGTVFGQATANVLKTGDTMSGRLVVSAGAAGGIAFPNDAFGGSGDTASITLETSSGEATKMTFRMTNDADDGFNFSAPSNYSMTLNGNQIWNAATDGAGSGLDADVLDGMQPSSNNYGNTVVSRDGNGNFQAGTISANLSGVASENVLRSGDTMSGYLTLNANPYNSLHAATKGYVDAVAATGYQFTYGNTWYTNGYTNWVGNWYNGANYFDVFPPWGKSMSNLVAFIPSIAVIHYAGGVNGDDSMRCTWSWLGDRIRVYVQNTEQRSTPAGNWLAVWR